MNPGIINAIFTDAPSLINDFISFYCINACCNRLLTKSILNDKYTDRFLYPKN